MAGIDLGISNLAAVSFGDEGVLYPGGASKEDEYWFHKKRAECDDASPAEAERLDRNRADRRTHSLHALSKDIVERCVEHGVGTIVVGDLSGIPDGENWGDSGNLGHGWAFDRFTQMLEYKAEERGIDVERANERGTSKTCSACGTEDGDQRVERGLYVCESCDTVTNADINGAENVRQSLAPDRGDRDNGWTARPAVRLFDKSTGRVTGREQVVDCKPYYPDYGREIPASSATSDCPRDVVPRCSRRGGCHRQARSAGASDTSIASQAPSSVMSAITYSCPEPASSTEATTSPFSRVMVDAPMPTSSTYRYISPSEPAGGFSPDR